MLVDIVENKRLGYLFACIRHFNFHMQKFISTRIHDPILVSSTPIVSKDQHNQTFVIYSFFLLEGYKVFKGQVLNSEDLECLYDGLKQNGLYHFSHVLTGSTCISPYLNVQETYMLRYFNINMCVNTVMNYLPGRVNWVTVIGVMSCNWHLSINLYGCLNLCNVQGLKVQSGWRNCSVIYKIMFSSTWLHQKPCYMYVLLCQKHVFLWFQCSNSNF